MADSATASQPAWRGLQHLSSESVLSSPSDSVLSRRCRAWFSTDFAPLVTDKWVAAWPGNFRIFLQAVRREIAYIGSVSWEALCRSCLVFLLTWLRPEMAGPGNGTPACVWEVRRALLPGGGTTLWAPPPQWRSEEESTFEEIFLCFRIDGETPVLAVRWYAISVAYCAKILKSFPGSGSLVSLAKGALWRTFSFCHVCPIATWLILPVVICLSQRLSHACLSTNFYIVKPRMAH